MLFSKYVLIYIVVCFRVNLIFYSILFNYFHTVTFLQVDAWLLADQHIKVKGQNNKLYSLSEACQDVVAYEKLTDDVSFCKVIHLFIIFVLVEMGLNLDRKISKIVRNVMCLIWGRKGSHLVQN